MNMYLYILAMALTKRGQDVLELMEYQGVRS